MIRKSKYRYRIMKQLIPYAHGIKRFVILDFICSVVIIGLEFSTPLFYKLFIDEVILNGQFRKMLYVVGGYLSIFFCGVLMKYSKNYARFTVANTVLYRVKYKIWQRLFKLPFMSYDTIGIGELKMRLEDNTARIEDFSGYQTIDYVIAIFTFLGSATLLFVIDSRLALFSVIVIPLTIKVDGFLSKRESVLINANRENDQSYSDWLYVSIQGWKEIKALNMQMSQKRQFVRFLHNYALFFGKWINYWTARVLVIPKIKNEFFMQFGLYFLGGLLIINGEIKISDLLVFVMYYNMFAKAMDVLSSTDAELQVNMPFTDHLILDLSQQEEITVEEGINPDHSNVISFENVCFSYTNTEKEILHDFNLKIEKGEKVAIIGKSGSGKTTLLKLMMGMLTPVSGKISFSGIDLKEINLSEMHKRIGFVMQENVLFNATIRENLLYGKSDASDAELLEACKKAYLYEFIMSLPDGLDTVLGEKGVKLSGGQRQRIILARVFLRDVEVFIFDEATSALDQYSENIIYDAIRSIGEDKTIIIVAHRESSISLCDRKVEIIFNC